MKKIQNTKVNGSVFKSVVRGVVQEELVKTEIKLEKRLTTNLTDVIDQRFEILTKNLTEKIDEKFDENFTKYRDDVLTKMDKAIAEMKKNNEEIAVHSGQHAQINDRLETLDKIHPDGKHI